MNHYYVVSEQFVACFHKKKILSPRWRQLSNTAIKAGTEERIMAVGIQGVPTTTVRQKGRFDSIFQSMNFKFVWAHFVYFIIVQTAAYTGHCIQCKQICRIKVTFVIEGMYLVAPKTEMGYF